MQNLPDCPDDERLGAELDGVPALGLGVLGQKRSGQEQMSGTRISFSSGGNENVRYSGRPSGNAWTFLSSSSVGTPPCPPDRAADAVRAHSTSGNERIKTRSCNTFAFLSKGTTA
jgi:hypothetical protein